MGELLDGRFSCCEREVTEGSEVRKWFLQMILLVDNYELVFLPPSKTKLLLLSFGDYHP